MSLWMVYTKFDLVCMHEVTAQARDLLFTTWRNQVKCVKYILHEAAIPGPAGGDAYFHGLIKIKRVVRQSVMQEENKAFREQQHHSAPRSVNE